MTSVMLLSVVVMVQIYLYDEGKEKEYGFVLPNINMYVCVLVGVNIFVWCFVNCGVNVININNRHNSNYRNLHL